MSGFLLQSDDIRLMLHASSCITRHVTYITRHVTYITRHVTCVTRHVTCITRHELGRASTHYSAHVRWSHVSCLCNITHSSAWDMRHETWLHLTWALCYASIHHTTHHTCLRASIPWYIPTYIHACTHTCMHTCMHAYLHACIHTYMHAYIHTYIHTGTSKGAARDTKCTGARDLWWQHPLESQPSEHETKVEVLLLLVSLH